LPESFRNRLEGWRDPKAAQCDSGWIDQSQVSGSPHVMHNVVHIYTGGVWESGGKTSEGTMAYNTSPNDPVFFVHHANVDRIWAAWELRGGGHYQPRKGAPYGWNSNDTMWPWFDRTINSWFGTERNGYRYASLPES
jgi:tyrosinase